MFALLNANYPEPSFGFYQFDVSRIAKVIRKKLWKKILELIDISLFYSENQACIVVGIPEYSPWVRTHLLLGSSSKSIKLFGPKTKKNVNHFLMKILSTYCFIFSSRQILLLSTKLVQLTRLV